MSVETGLSITIRFGAFNIYVHFSATLAKLAVAKLVIFTYRLT